MTRLDGLAFWTIVYSGTGALQPILVEHLSVHGYAPKAYMWPMLANTLGMSLVLPLRNVWMTLIGDRSRRPVARSSESKWLQILGAALLDAVSAALLTLALLRSGAAAFSVAYSSCAMLVAVLGWILGVRQRQLFFQQWLALLLATFGLIFYSMARKTEEHSIVTNTDAILDVGLALLGSIGHSGVFVLAEYLTKEKARDTPPSLTPFELSSYIGAIQCIALLFLGIALDTINIDRPSLFEPGLLSGYFSLTVVDALHALAFFTTLGAAGAVHAAMLKGVQVVLVYIVTKLLAACLDSSSYDFLSCLLSGLFSQQAFAVFLVVISLRLFYGGDTGHQTASSEYGIHAGMKKAKHSDSSFDNSVSDHGFSSPPRLPSSSSAEHLLYQGVVENPSTTLLGAH